MGKNAKANFGRTDENAVMQYFCVKCEEGKSAVRKPQDWYGQ